MNCCLVKDENNDASIKVRISTIIVSMLTWLELCSGLLLILTFPIKERIEFGLDTKLIW